MTGAATVEELRAAVASFGWALRADDSSVTVRVPNPIAGQDHEPEPEPELDTVTAS